MSERPCSRCGGVRDGSHQTYCRDCYAAYVKVNRAGRRDGYLAYQREWNKANPTKRAGYRRKSHLKNLFGITHLQHLEMQTFQGGRCANPGCGVVLVPQSKGGDGEAIDHCHTTNQVRGLLCTHCNLALGLLKDDAERIVGLADYLQGFAATSTHALKEA